MGGLLCRISSMWEAWLCWCAGFWIKLARCEPWNFPVVRDNVWAIAVMRDVGSLLQCYPFLLHRTNSDDTPLQSYIQSPRSCSQCRWALRCQIVCVPMLKRFPLLYTEFQGVYICPLWVDQCSRWDCSSLSSILAHNYKSQACYGTDKECWYCSHDQIVLMWFLMLLLLLFSSFCFLLFLLFIIFTFLNMLHSCYRQQRQALRSS